jgi:hypothetical protein
MHLRSTRRNDDVPEQDGVMIGNDGDQDAAWGWQSVKPVFAVSFEWPDGLKRSFRYMHLESDMTFRDDKIVMRFSGMKTHIVTITGLRLSPLYHLLQEDKMRVVRQAVRDFDVGDNEPLIRSIVIDEEKADLED